MIPLTITWSTPEPHAARAKLEGDFDFDTADALLHEVIDRLPGLRDLHLDMAALGFCDSYGLSILLMIRRHTEAGETCLHLENRPATLDRMLTVTNTLNHLTGSAIEAHQQTPEP